MRQETLKRLNTEHLFQPDKGSPWHNLLTHYTACLRAHKNPITGRNRIIVIIGCDYMRSIMAIIKENPGFQSVILSISKCMCTQ